MTYEHILFASEGGIARLTLNRPDRLNSFNDAMHAEVRDAMARVKSDTTTRVLLLTGAGRGFCAGQDLGDRAVAPGEAPVDLGASIERNYKPLILALRALPMPVVCAVNGVAAGAGANLALACDLVIAAKTASFIQAFCKLGLVPDAGGTYFLPRLVGHARALGLCASGREAVGRASGAMGTDLAMRRRRGAAGRDGEAPHATSHRRRPVASLRSRKRCRPPRAIRCRSSSMSSATCSGCSATAPTIAKESRRSPPSGRRASPENSRAVAEALAKDSIVAVIGAGAMGAGIAQIAALHGHRVQLHDTRLGAGDAAKRGIAEALDKQVERGRIARADADAALGRIATVVTLPDVCVAQLVVEAIVEDLAAKRELLERVENVVEDTCIVASNTSSLSITALAAGMKRPGRIVGMHFFNPAPLMPLVEVVSGLATSTVVAETVFATAQAWGKTPVYATSTPGFIVNRCARPYYAEGLRLLAERAADVATLDAVLREAGGFRMGPFELIDLIGLDVNLAVTKSVWAAYFHDPRYAPSVLQEERVTAGFFGRKSGRGFLRLHAWRCEARTCHRERAARTRRA